MTATLRLDADLRLEVETGTAGDDPGRSLRASLTGSGSTLTLRLDGTDVLPIGSPTTSTLDTVRDLAQMLADEGLTLVVATGERRLASLGVVEQRLGDRVLSGSRHLAIHDRRGVLRLVRSRGAGGAPALTALMPPSTPWPFTPTFTPPRRRRVTTTHDPLGGGNPRLVYYPAAPELGGLASRQELHLRRGVTTVGGAPEDDLVVAGLQPGHLRIERDPTSDEYEVVPVPDALTTVGGRAVEAPVALRTGMVLRAGDLELTYAREEYADHGRPYGGRQGGEFSRQRPQRRPRYQR